jgi:hypothetical protein
MHLTTGTLLRPHEIISAIGADGMGEVYKTRALGQATVQ